MSRPPRRGAPKPCGCVWLTHAVTGRNVTPIRWCQKHKPQMHSMTGKPVRQGEFK